jgi:endonuclease YncB( thermonuclease family)
MNHFSYFTRNRLFVLWAIVLCALLYRAADLNAASMEVQGKIVAVIDGDTYDVITAQQYKYRVRMEGIDAPERGMRFYKESKNYLSALALGKQVRVRWTKTDRSKRLIAFTYLGNSRELSHEMIKAGWAWHFTKYNKDSDLAALERTARLRRLGLWVDPNPVAPWDYRKSRRSPRK